MNIHWLGWLKLKPKIGVNTQLKQPVTLSKGEMLANKLRDLCSNVDIDMVYNDTVKRRYMLTVYWSSISYLFEVLISGKRDNDLLTGVSISNYFKSAGTPPSVCLSRLSDMIAKQTNISITVQRDIETLIDQLTEIGKHQGVRNERVDI